MSRRAIIKRGKIRRARFLESPYAWLARYGLCRLIAAPENAKTIISTSIDDLEPSAEEKAAAQAFFAKADEWGGPMSDDMKAHLVWEDTITTTS